MATSAIAAMLDDPTLTADVRTLSKLSGWHVSWAIARQWLVIGVTIAFAAHYDAWWAYLPAIVIIASRQHALGIIMHDATHFRLFANRTVNDLVSDFFCAFPTGLSTLGYREQHLEHHLSTNTPDDPYYRMFQNDPVWHWPKSRGEAARQLLADVTGFNTLRSLRMQHPWTAMGQWRLHRKDDQAARVRRDLLLSWAFWGTVIALVTLFGGWKLFLLCWFVPGLTFYQLFIRLRWISEHPYGEATSAGYETRHVQGTWLERVTIAPLNINYHIAHHLYPAVPFYRLPAVHERLLRCPAYLEQAERFHDYLGTDHSIRAELVTPAAT